MTSIEEYHQETTNVLLAIGKKSENGFWAPVCVDHVYSTGNRFNSPNYRVPMNSDNSVNDCLKRWINGESDPANHRHIDMTKWPDNKPCSGLKNSGNIQTY